MLFRPSHSFPNHNAPNRHGQSTSRATHGSTRALRSTTNQTHKIHLFEFRDVKQTLEATKQKPKCKPITRLSRRRGIQSVYFLALKPSFATSICKTLNGAPKGKTIEIEFSAAHDTGWDAKKKEKVSRGWANAITAITEIIDHPLILTVDFGHHKVADKAAYDWGKDLCEGLFRAHYQNVKIILQVANEDDYPDTDWQTNMTDLLNGLRDAWGDVNTFPYNRLFLRRTPILDGATVQSPFLFDNHSIKVEKEYHFPDDQSDIWDKSGTVISNDGQMLYRNDKDPERLASDDSGLLRKVKLAEFKCKYRDRALLLWHPALHRWRYDEEKKTYLVDKDSRADASKAREQGFIGLLEDFLKD